MTIENIPLSLTLPPTSQINLQTDRIESTLSHVRELPGKAREDQLRKATQDFEALFLSYMLKVMRSTVESEKGESSSLGKDLYLEMFDNEISLNIARDRGLGLGEMMYRELTGKANQGQKPGIPSDEKARETDSPDQPNALSSRVKPTLSQETESQTLDETFVAPIHGELTSPFGLRRHPLTQEARFHQGLDIAAPSGTPFQAAQDGTVVFSGFLGGYGNTIILEHADGYRTLYAHAAKLLVSQGDKVSAEQKIGIIGNTGRSTGTHLHFELQRGAEKADPIAFLTSRK